MDSFGLWPSPWPLQASNTWCPFIRELTVVPYELSQKVAKIQESLIALLLPFLCNGWFLVPSGPSDLLSCVIMLNLRL